MSYTRLLPLLLSQLVGQSPLIAVYILGIVLCAANRRRMPTAAGYTIAGMSLMLLATVGTALLQIWYQTSRRSSGPGVPMSIGVWFAVIALVGSLLRAGGLGLVLAGVFAGRPKEY